MSEMLKSRARLAKEILVPMAYPHLVRLGPAEDGGYVVPQDAPAGTRLLLSLGLSDNWGFDQEFVLLNPEVTLIGIDHTVGPATFRRGIFRCLWKIAGYTLIFHRAKRKEYTKRLRDYASYPRFFSGRNRHLQRRVVGKIQEDVDIRLGEILGQEPSGESCDVFLKMDIEGSEYEIIPDIMHHQSRIGYIAAEFHELDRRTDEFNQALRCLLQHFVIVHIHGNNCGHYDSANDFPATVEITFINKNLVPKSVALSVIRYPREGLDFPNNPKRPDYPLHFNIERTQGLAAPQKNGNDPVVG